MDSTPLAGRREDGVRNRRATTTIEQNRSIDTGETSYRRWGGNETFKVGKRIILYERSEIDLRDLQRCRGREKAERDGYRAQKKVELLEEKIMQSE